MSKNLLFSLVAIASMSMFPYASFAAADECQADADCKDGKICVLVANPKVCKAPQPAGSTCKRDAGCASKHCDIPAGKDAGLCK